MNRLAVLNASDFDQVYALMTMSFPAPERRPYEDQRALLRNPHYRIVGYKDPSARAVISFIALYDLDDMLFLEHFAVRPADRNRGIGRAVLQEVLTRADKRVCLEVERPETKLAERRIGFYQSNGFFLNRYSYQQPPLSPDTPAVPLWLMTTGAPLTPSEFITTRAHIYAHVYHVTPPVSP